MTILFPPDTGPKAEFSNEIEIVGLAIDEFKQRKGIPITECLTVADVLEMAGRLSGYVCQIEGIHVITQKKA